MTRTKKIVLLTIVILLIVVVSSAAWLYTGQNNRPGHSTAAKSITSQKKITVKLQKPTIKTIPTIVTTTGTLLANQKVVITAKVSGYITKINFKPGQYVKAKQVLIQLDNRKEQEALAVAKDKLALAKSGFDKWKKLYKKGLAKYQYFYQYKTTYEQALDSYQMDKINLANKTIRAPFAGYIGARNISAGNYVEPGNTLATLVDKHILRVNYTLPSRYAPRVKLGQTLRLQATNQPNKKFKAKVNFIAPLIDINSQTILIRALFDNKKSELKPGQSVTITQRLGQHRAMLVPTNSVYASIAGYHVYSVKDGKAVEIPVKIGERFKHYTEILKGLSAKQSVIVAGATNLKAGSAVKIVK